jgi:aryl-alcohol dehydrogenase-like predicted oxidoreductase
MPNNINSNTNYYPLGSTDLLVSPAGFGSYRVHISVDEHKEALKHALLNGINLIDTSSNYADGGSEELIGAVLKELTTTKKISRDKIVLVSKAGYLQGQNYQLSQRLKQQKKSFSELVEYAPDLEHCIHPDFIADQLNHSLKRLQQKYIDVYLLHNPEYYLLWADKKGLSAEAAQKEYYRRIERAFMHLEIEAQNGRIKCYGISSNTFPVSEDRYDFTSLEKVWEIAQSISKDHKFRVIQFPMNLIENGAANEFNQSNQQNILDFATTKNIGVLANRPLNAFADNAMIRLVHLISESQPSTLMFDKIIALESEFMVKILPLLDVSEDKRKDLAGQFSTGTYLSYNLEKLVSYWTWMDDQSRFISEQVSNAVQIVNEIPDNDQEVIEWLDTYVTSFNELLNAITGHLGLDAAKKSQKIYEQISAVDSDWQKTNNLTELALRALRSTKGISSILIGMRNTYYVNDVLNELRFDITPMDKTESWRKVKGLLSK